MRISLLGGVKKWLSDERGNWPQIAEEAGVGYEWLTALMQGDIKDPGIQKIERLAAVKQEREAA